MSLTSFLHGSICEIIYIYHIYSPMCFIWSLVSPIKPSNKNPSVEFFRGGQLFLMGKEAKIS